VVAPFPGRVVNLNISVGAFASAGIPVFSLLDTRKWYVMANFREGELPHIEPGTRVELYLSSLPTRRFAGTVQGVGWAVAPTDVIDIPHGLPLVKRELNWVHIAQRFPVRIEVEKPGFARLIKPDVALHVQDALEINFELKIGSVSETVTVEGGAPLVNTESATVSTVVDRTFVENLPLNGRSFQTLIMLTPGVVMTPADCTFAPASRAPAASASSISAWPPAR